MTAPAIQAAPPASGAPASAGAVATYALEAAAAARAAQLVLRAALLRDVVRLWPLLDRKQLAQTFPGWLRAMQLLVTSYHGQSAQAAAVFYRTARAAALQSPTPADLIKLAAAPDPEWMAKAFGFSGPGMMGKDTARPGSALSTTLGTAARIALDGGRATMTGTAHADPAAVGYFRLTDGSPCAFCAMLAGRGVVYKEHSFDASDRKFTGGGADKVHNLCGCTLAPAFSRKQQLPLVNAVARDVYIQSTHSADGDQKLVAFRKAWAEHQGTGLPQKAPAQPKPPSRSKTSTSRDTRTPVQVRGELSVLEQHLLTAKTTTEREYLTKRIGQLRTQLGL